ncbi:hypothetical protein [Corynebacterium parakroppenstedtii]|uniref:hypothetical protein n=1 Tax=Corynebacterium parakroppenstedtii TaxID=2828363 RepID=UPI001C8F6D0D|nr:hypothetical protein [Corynebacterium parakroppenstedtii]MBY0795217.1 hypothetical protein [Corynebacterium parakroppenstedtii]
MEWRRHLRYFVPAPFVAFLLFATWRVGYIIGYWPDVNEVHSETLALIGVCLAGCTAYDTARHDVDYLRTISSTCIRRSWYLCGLGARYALIYNVVTIVVLYAVCLSGDPGGYPWWSIPIMGLIWSLFSVGLGGVIGRSLHTKPRLAAIVGFIAGMTVVVLTLMAGLLRVVPKILFLRPYSSGNYVGYVEQSVQLRPVVVGVVIGIALVAVLIFVTTADWVRGKKLLSLALPVIAVFSVAATLVGINGPLVTAREKPSNPSCTRSADGARYCSWPEDESTVREVDKNWSAFLSELDELGFSVDAGEYAPKKVGGDFPLMAADAGRSSTLVFRDLAETVIAQDSDKSGCQLSETDGVSTTYIVAEWIADHFGDKPIHEVIGGANGPGTSDAQKWMDKNTDGRPFQEQEERIKNITGDLKACIASSEKSNAQDNLEE